MAKPAKYYNTTRGPINVPLRDGTTLYIAPYQWSEPVSSERDGSAELRRRERLGDLKRRLCHTD